MNLCDKQDGGKKVSFRTQIRKKDCYQQVSLEPGPTFLER